MAFHRRQFLGSIAALSAAGYGLQSFAAMGPNDKFDLLIKGGDVLDPSQGLRGKRDIGIRFGLVAEVANDIPAERAERVLKIGRASCRERVSLVV